MEKETCFSKIESYLELLKQHSHLRSSRDTPLQIVESRCELLDAQEHLYHKADEEDLPRKWFDLGIIAEDQWTVVLRDLVQFPDGTFGGYTRVLNRKSQVERTGKDVVILIIVDGKVLLQKHFRHDDRMWHWECPRGFGEAGLTAYENAKKEVVEETGLSVLTLEQMNGAEESVTYFTAHCVGKPGNHDEIECIGEYVLLTSGEVDGMVVDGRINDLYTLRALALGRIKGELRD